MDRRAPMTTGKVVALIRALSVQSGTAASFTTLTASTALVVGAATTSGVRLDLESGELAIREGDDSAYGKVHCLGIDTTGNGWNVTNGGVLCTSLGLSNIAFSDGGSSTSPVHTIRANGLASGGELKTHLIRSASGSLTSGASYTFTSALPAGSIILGLTAKITTTITGPTSVQIGDGTDADRYGVFSTLTSGQGITPANATASPLEWRSAAGDVVLTAVGGGGAFTAGAVSIVVYYLTFTAPSS